MTGVVEGVVRGGVINPGPLGVWSSRVVVEFTGAIVEEDLVVGVEDETGEDDACCRGVGVKSLPDCEVLIVEDIMLDELDDDDELPIKVIEAGNGLGSDPGLLRKPNENLDFFSGTGAR